MTGIKFPFQRWSIVGWSALAISIMVALIWVVHGIDEQGMRVTLRATARTSCLLFLSAFVASALRRTWSTRLTAWMLKNRRYLGVSFAVSHAFHAFAIISLALITSGAAPKPSFAEILGYIFIIAMTATSFERTTAWLNRLHQRAWKILHTVGMYYLWLAFTYAFSTNLAKSMLYLPFVILLVLAMMLRLFALVIYPKMQSKIEAEPSNQVY